MEKIWITVYKVKMKDISDPVKNELGVRTTHVWHRAELSKWWWWWGGWIKRLRLNSWGQPCKSRNSPQERWRRECWQGGMGREECKGWFAAIFYRMVSSFLLWCMIWRLWHWQKDERSRCQDLHSEWTEWTRHEYNWRTTWWIWRRS